MKAKSSGGCESYLKIRIADAPDQRSLGSANPKGCRPPAQGWPNERAPTLGSADQMQESPRGFRSHRAGRNPDGVEHNRETSVPG